ncbi:hypothetical protein CU098_004185, partial [Rhizopus stolonifer]
WSQTCFSADGEFVIGGSGHKAEHNIYIWDKNIGNLVKILEGPKEPLDDLTWHPSKPVIGSVSSFGNIYIWSNKQDENWSSFAPDFIELEENLEYEENEDEFDVMPDYEKSKQRQVGEDVLVDVTTCDSIKAFIESSDEEDEDEVYYLPTLSIDNEEEENYDDDDDRSLSSDEEYRRKLPRKRGSEILRKKKRSDILKKKQCLWYLASSQNQEYFLAFKVQNNFSSTRVVVYNQWEKNIDTTHMNTLIDHLILLSSLPYVSSCDSLQIISLKYKDFNTCEIEYEYRDTIQSTTSPPVSIKSHKWHSGSWSQDKNFFSARLLSSPSLLSAPQFRPSISCPDNNQSVLQWDNVDQEDKSNKLRIKTTDYPKVYVSLPHHNDWSEKFIQLCVRATPRKQHRKHPACENNARKVKEEPIYHK